tara:strand:+ start:100 stop:258 length:159 start_codon:yes stop_codon:yes gene_type:complete
MDTKTNIKEFLEYIEEYQVAIDRELKANNQPIASKKIWSLIEQLEKQLKEAC